MKEYHFQISKIFPDLPPLLDIERNQSLSLLNTHFSVGGAVPLLPSQVEVGGMHCRGAQPLPEVSCLQCMSITIQTKKTYAKLWTIVYSARFK